MATASPPATTERGARKDRVALSERWTSLAIGVSWFVVLLDALFGPDLIINNSSGFTKLPSAIFLAFLAWLATRVVARYGFGHSDDE